MFRWVTCHSQGNLRWRFGHELEAYLLIWVILSTSCLKTNKSSARRLDWLEYSPCVSSDYRMIARRSLPRRPSACLELVRVFRSAQSRNRTASCQVQIGSRRTGNHSAGGVSPSLKSSPIRWNGGVWFMPTQVIRHPSPRYLTDRAARSKVSRVLRAM